MSDIDTNNAAYNTNKLPGSGIVPNNYCDLAIYNSELIDRNKSNGWEDLTHEQKAFAYEYLNNGFNHNKAASTLGLGKSAGRRLLANPLVRAFINHLQEETQSHSLVTKQFVDAVYMNLLPKLMGEEKVNIVTASGAEMQAKKFFAGESVALARDMAKHCGYIDQGNNVNTQVNVNISMEKSMDILKQAGVDVDGLY